MYIKKFSANTLDETLKQIKRELGPEAIILKTVTNKGIKGILNKNKIEITAALSQKEYLKKSKMDGVLSEGQKESLYKSSASNIANALSTYTDYDSRSGKEKVENRYIDTKEKIKKRKDKNKRDERNLPGNVEEFLQTNNSEDIYDKIIKDNYDNNIQDISDTKDQSKELENQVISKVKKSYHPNNNIGNKTDRLDIETDKSKISILENRISELERNWDIIRNGSSSGLSQLCLNLRCLSIAEDYIQKIIRKAIFELRDEELDDYEQVFEFALREIHNGIKTSGPLFSNVNIDKKPVITVLLSNFQSGQTSMMLKMSRMLKNILLISYLNNDVKERYTFSSSFIQSEVVNANNLSDVISLSRKAVEKGQSVFIDYKKFDFEKDETSEFVSSLKKAFENVEILASLSAIHTETYNRKILLQHRQVIDGVVYSFLDQCLNYGELLNTHLSFSDLPIKLFGVGKMIPEDIELARPERIMAGLFKL